MQLLDYFYFVSLKFYFFVLVGEWGQGESVDDQVSGWRK